MTYGTFLIDGRDTFMYDHGPTAEWFEVGSRALWGLRQESCDHPDANGHTISDTETEWECDRCGADLGVVEADGWAPDGRQVVILNRGADAIERGTR